MTNDLTELRKIAEAATPGPWEDERFEMDLEWWVSCEAYGRMLNTGYVGNSESRPNAEHIAAFDPPTVLDLLSRIEALEAKVAASLDVAEWIRDNHGDYISREIEERLRDALDGGA